MIRCVEQARSRMDSASRERENGKGRWIKRNTEREGKREKEKNRTVTARSTPPQESLIMIIVRPRMAM